MPTVIDPKQLANAAERAAVYQLLAQLWAKEVDARLLSQLTTGPLRNAWERDFTPGRQTIELLHRDYCQLFLGPQGHVPAVQSVWEERRFEGDAAASMREYFRVLNFDPTFGGALPPDHAANILASCGHLLSSFAADDNTTDRSDYADLYSALYVSHVGWIRELAVAAGNRARTDFYCEVLKMTAEFLALEAGAA